MAFPFWVSKQRTKIPSWLSSTAPSEQPSACCGSMWRALTTGRPTQAAMSTLFRRWSMKETDRVCLSAFTPPTASGARSLAVRLSSRDILFGIRTTTVGLLLTISILLVDGPSQILSSTRERHLIVVLVLI